MAEPEIKIKKKEFTTTRVGNLQQLEDGKFIPKGKITIGLDDQKRLKAIVNIGEESYSCFLNEPIDAKELEQFRKWKADQDGK